MTEPNVSPAEVVREALFCWGNHPDVMPDSACVECRALTALDTLIAERERLEGERDRAREDCGHEKHMRKFISDEMSGWIRKATAAEDENEKLKRELTAALADVVSLKQRNLLLMRASRNDHSTCCFGPVRAAPDGSDE